MTDHEARRLFDRLDQLNEKIKETAVGSAFLRNEQGERTPLDMEAWTRAVHERNNVELRLVAGLQ